MDITAGARESFEACVRLEKEGKVAEAEAAYIAFIRDAGGSRETWVNLGSLYARTDRLDDAMASFERALEYGEDHVVYFNIASIHYKRRDYKRAIISLGRSKAQKGDFALASLVMGLSYSRLKNRKAAENCFRDVVKALPGNLIALTALAILYYQSGRLQGSLKLVNRILVLDTENAGIRKLRARILYRLNRLTEYAGEIKVIKDTAEEFLLFDEFIRSIPAEVFTDRYGTMDEKMRKLREKARDGADASSLVSLSLCHLLNGDTDKAVDYLMEARRRGFRVQRENQANGEIKLVLQGK